MESHGPGMDDVEATLEQRTLPAWLALSFGLLYAMRARSLCASGAGSCWESWEK